MIYVTTQLKTNLKNLDTTSESRRFNSIDVIPSMNNLSHTRIFSGNLEILQEIKSDRVQFLVPCPVHGKEDEILKKMHGVANFVKTCLPPN